MNYLKADIPADHPQRRLFMRLEKQAQDDIAQALEDYRRDIFRGINADNVRNITMRATDREVATNLQRRLYNAILPSLQAGVDVGIGQVNKEIFGVKAEFDTAFAVNWDMVNEDARQWLAQYTFDLVRGINNTTSNAIQREVDAYITDGGMTINQLRDRLAPTFGESRARTIAVTEVTRTFAEGNQQAWQGSGVVKRNRWNTANDEIVRQCPICWPVHEEVRPIGEAFSNGATSPPGHPNCRCWLTPYIDVMALVDDAFIEELEEADTEAFAFIRPPEGRAPRGMGQEYADRRAIYNKLTTQSNYATQNQRYIDNYRGQRNQRRRYTQAVRRKQELDKAISAALQFLEEDADWAFKREMVDSIFAYVSEITSLS
jgi:SPP1 gp7 family putative phage head morphogenesis protein